MSDYLGTRRDRLAVWLANWILNHVASKTYRAFVHVTIKRGLESLSAQPPEEP